MVALLAEGSTPAPVNDGDVAGHAGSDDERRMLEHRGNEAAMAPALIGVTHLNAGRLQKAVVVGAVAQDDEAIDLVLPHPRIVQGKLEGIDGEAEMRPVGKVSDFRHADT